MSWHWTRLSTLAILALLYLSPLSSGDKGLWLSLGVTPLPYLEVATDRLPAEHSILLPERASRTGREEIVARGERPDLAQRLLQDRAIWLPGATERWTTVVVASSHHQDGEPFAAHPAPRAPPA